MRWSCGRAGAVRGKVDLKESGTLCAWIALEALCQNAFVHRYICDAAQRQMAEWKRLRLT